MTRNTRASRPGGQVEPLRLALRRRFHFLGHQQRERHAAADRDRARHGECGPPAEVLDEQAGHQRRNCDAEVAGKAVDADRPSRPRCVLHQHRNADRVVDGRKQPDAHQPRSQLPRPVGEARHERRATDADEEDDHHHPPAPQVAEPPGRQRADAEQEERADAVRHQRFPAREPEVRGDGGYRRREDQEEHVVERVSDVEQQRRRQMGVGCPRAGGGGGCGSRVDCTRSGVRGRARGWLDGRIGGCVHGRRSG